MRPFVCEKVFLKLRFYNRLLLCVCENYDVVCERDFFGLIPPPLVFLQESEGTRDIVLYIRFCNQHRFIQQLQHPVK